jgi:hypothetical protein
LSGISVVLVDLVNVLFENDESESFFFGFVSSVEFVLEVAEFNFVLIDLFGILS